VGCPAVVPDSENQVSRVGEGGRNPKAIWVCSAPRHLKKFMAYLAGELNFKELDRVGRFVSWVNRSNLALAELFEVSVRTVVRWVKELVNGGWLEVERCWYPDGSRAPNAYRLSEKPFKHYVPARKGKSSSSLKKIQSDIYDESKVTPVSSVFPGEDIAPSNTPPPTPEITQATQFFDGGGGEVFNNGEVVEPPTDKERELAKELEKILGVRSSPRGLLSFYDKLRYGSVASAAQIKKDAEWIRDREGHLGDPTVCITRVFELAGAKKWYLKWKIKPLVDAINRTIRDRGVSLNDAQNECLEASGWPAVICADVRLLFKQVRR
jgi:hypothetical protein